MKNVTLSADESLIDAARNRARSTGTTLNDEFRRWLADYAHPCDPVDTMLAVIKELQTKADTGGRRFSRDERNER